uniref:metal ABC transporter solute-binding protein, Zn/Mn family n=1 Tax=Calothrix sp. NIES-2100 TaxID=1954172 RepID=UPI0030DBEB7A
MLKFEEALGGISTEAAPTAARVSALVKDIQKTGVPTIFAEVTNDAKLITAVNSQQSTTLTE